MIATAKPGATGVLDSDQVIGDESLLQSTNEPDSIDGAYGASNNRCSCVG